MKILAMYLPQFHRVKENDEWWGEGFTDWEPTKKAEPICDGHYQPHIPLNKNYYDLLQKQTMQWQADLMHKYGIDGMCIYHYYFKEGRKILEKPAENLLEWTDIDMPFCFYWANESWKRSWSNIPNANVWQSDDEKPEDSSDSGLLLDQQYGDEKDWIEHFEYLLPFFKDSRYIKIGEKPVIIIYRTSQVTCLGEMLECWKRLAIENGLSGIYVMGAYANAAARRYLDGVLYHEPPNTMVSLREAGVGKSAYSITYKTIMEAVLKEPKLDITTYFSCFTGFDDTPRRGKRGNALVGVTPELYQEFLSRTIAKNQVAGNEFTFINAWNEWGEGMHLEPDEKYGYSFLEATLDAKKGFDKYINEYSGFLDEHNEYLYLQEKADKFEQYTRVLDRWMELRELGVNICEYFSGNRIKNIAIYGYGNFGRHLHWEIKRNNVNLDYIIDQQGQKLSDEIKIYYPSDNLPDTDLIVITTFWISSEIKKILPNTIKTVSLDEIIAYFQDR